MFYAAFNTGWRKQHVGPPHEPTEVDPEVLWHPHGTRDGSLLHIDAARLPWRRGISGIERAARAASHRGNGAPCSRLSNLRTCRGATPVRHRSSGRTSPACSARELP